MRICIDATPLGLQSGGIKNYLYHWIRALRAGAESDTGVRLFPPFGTIRELDHARSVFTDFGTRSGLAWIYAANYLPVPVLDWFCRRDDVFHMTNQTWHPPARTRVTATVYDMTCSLLPQFHTAGNLEMEARFIENARRATRLIAISESTKNDLVRTVDVSPEKVDVIYPGIAGPYFEVSQETVEAFRRRAGLDAEYVLFVGAIEPRKNLDLLLTAYLSLPGSVREQFQLVAAGLPGWSCDATMARLKAGLPGVRYLGYVPERDMPALTAGATVLAYPSLYEGFGFPVAQAMAAGVAVLTSNCSSMPEVVGEAGVLVDPHSEDEIGSALERLLLSPELRSRLSLAGRRQSHRYRWAECARESLQFFKRACEGG